MDHYETFISSLSGKVESRVWRVRKRFEGFIFLREHENGMHVSSQKSPVDIWNGSQMPLRYAKCHSVTSSPLK